MSIKVLYLLQNLFYTSPKQISGYAPGDKALHLFATFDFV